MEGYRSGPKRPRAQRLGTLALRRDAVGAECYVNLISIEQRLDKARGEIEQAAASVMRRQIEQVVRVAAKAIDEGNAKALDRIDIPYQGELTDSIAGCLKELFDFGAAEVREELVRMQGSPIAGLELDPASFLRAKARSLVSILAAKVKGALVLEGLRQVRIGRADTTKLTEDLRGLSDRELRKAADISASEALNMGRDAEAKRSRVEFATYSAILDANVCSPCAANDGQRVQVGSVQYDSLNPPYSGCAGRDRCRCIWAYEGPILVPSDLG